MMHKKETELVDKADATRGAHLTQRPGNRLVSAVLMGTLLNPLNSSMITVTLILIQTNFRISVTTVSLLLSSFALAAAIAQPLMGRFSDLFGSRRVFCTGLLMVGIASAFAPFVPAFGWLIAIRMVQALGTSAAYPAGLAIIRAGDPQGQAPTGTLGAISITSSVSVALGPVLGGFLARLSGWPAIFLVNIPLVIVGLILALRWLPADSPPGLTTLGDSPSRLSVAHEVLRMVDVPGIVLFSGMLASLLAFLLSLASGPLWLLLPVALLAAVLLVLRERGVAEPFLNVRMLAANRPLIGVYAQFAGVNIVFYAVFFSMPLWLEQVHGFDSGMSGLLLLPIAGMGVLATPIAARLISKSGPGPALIIGTFALAVGSLLLLVFNAATPVIVILAVGVVLGIPNGFNNLGLQAALYEHAPARQMGAASGQFQTFRYVGVILATSLLGTTITSDGLHIIAVILTIISVLLLLASIPTYRLRHGMRGE
ncbi:MAG TPA: MFS transporter [Ktedonosporobacter sp.]|nr:MFS transporter [Ktedonosporobacter sp.]